MARQGTLNKMVAAISRNLSALNFFMNANFISYCESQVLELCHIFKGFIFNQKFMIFSSIFGDETQSHIQFSLCLLLDQPPY
jgi:hypothetical protein